MTARRVLISLSLALAALVAGPAAARADDSLIRISEVYSDNSAAGDADFVEFQLTTAGQSMTTGHHLYWFGPTGTLLGDAPFPPGSESATFTDTQRTILIGNSPGGIPADFAITMDKLQLPAAGGAVCLSVLTIQLIDCASWGSFATVNGPINAHTGTPAPALTASASLNRSKIPGCATLLEVGDDTNNSATDFSLGATSPRLNGASPTEISCDMPAAAAATATKKCKKKKKRHAAAAKKKRCKKKKK